MHDINWHMMGVCVHDINWHMMSVCVHDINWHMMTVVTVPMMISAVFLITIALDEFMDLVCSATMFHIKNYVSLVVTCSDYFHFEQ